MVADSLSNEHQSSTPTLVLKDFGCVQNSRWLFQNMNLEVPPGSFIAVLGASGAGKTSFLSTLCGLLKPTEGEVSFHDNETRLFSPIMLRGRIGIIPQGFHLTENTTVLNNVLCGRLNRYSFFQTLFGFPSSSKDEAYRIIHDLGISEYTYRWVAELSGGEKQRVVIARALFQKPDIYLADEPVSQLDVYLTGRVLGILKLETTRHGKTVFCVMHNPDLVDRFADYALSLNREKPDKWQLRKISK